MLINSGNVIWSTRSVLTSFKLNLSDISEHYWYFIKHIFCLHGMKFSLLLRQLYYVSTFSLRFFILPSISNILYGFHAIPPTFFAGELLSFTNRTKAWEKREDELATNKIEKDGNKMIDSTWNCSIKLMTHLSNLTHIKINFSLAFFLFLLPCYMLHTEKKLLSGEIGWARHASVES